MDKFQLSGGRPWRAPRWADNTGDDIPPRRYSFQVSGLWGFKTSLAIGNWDLCSRCRMFFFFSPQKAIWARSGTPRTNRAKTTERSPRRRSVIRTSPRCLNERRREGLKQRWILLFCFSFYSAFKPTHLSRGRKHGGLISPGSCREERENEKKRNRLWKSEINNGKRLSGGWVFRRHLLTHFTDVSGLEEKSKITWSDAENFSTAVVKVTAEVFLKRKQCYRWSMDNIFHIKK